MHLVLRGSYYKLGEDLLKRSSIVSIEWHISEIRLDRRAKRSSTWTSTSIGRWVIMELDLRSRSRGSGSSARRSGCRSCASLRHRVVVLVVVTAAVAAGYLQKPAALRLALLGPRHFRFWGLVWQLRIAFRLMINECEGSPTTFIELLLLMRLGFEDVLETTVLCPLSIVLKSAGFVSVC